MLFRHGSVKRGDDHFPFDHRLQSIDQDTHQFPLLLAGVLLLAFRTRSMVGTDTVKCEAISCRVCSRLSHIVLTTRV